MILVFSGLSANAELSHLEALSMIESGDNDAAIGKAGEISRYQIKVSVWQRYSRSKSYRNPEVAARVARKHLTSLETQFRQRAGREPDHFDRYVMWNGGFSYYSRRGFSPARVHPVVRERATRYANLCSDGEVAGMPSEMPRWAELAYGDNVRAPR